MHCSNAPPGTPCSRGWRRGSTGLATRWRLGSKWRLLHSMTPYRTPWCWQDSRCQMEACRPHSLDGKFRLEGRMQTSLHRASCRGGRTRWRSLLRSRWARNCLGSRALRCRWHPGSTCRRRCSTSSCRSTAQMERSMCPIGGSGPANTDATRSVRARCVCGTCMAGRFTAVARQQGSAATKISHHPRPEHASPATRTRLRC